MCPSGVRGHDAAAMLFYSFSYGRAKAVRRGMTGQETRDGSLIDIETRENGRLQPSVWADGGRAIFDRRRVVQETSMCDLRGGS